MNQQLKFVAKSETSHAAAKEIAPRVPAMRSKVLNMIKAFGPATDQEIAVWSGMSENSVRPRRVELARSGEIVEDGFGLTTSGRRAVRWRAA